MGTSYIPPTLFCRPIHHTVQLWAQSILLHGDSWVALLVAGGILPLWEGRSLFLYQEIYGFFSLKHSAELFTNCRPEIDTLPLLSTASPRSGQPVPQAVYKTSSCISETGGVNSLWRKGECKPSLLS